VITVLPDGLEARFGRMLEAIPDAVVVVDEAGRVSLVNRAAEELLGYSRRQLLGEPVDRLIPEGLTTTTSSSAGAEVPAPVAGTGRLERIALRRDGTALLVDISLGSVETDADTFTLASIRDVTERRRAETRLRAMLEAGPDALVIVDEAGRIVLVNSRLEQLFGYARTELLERPLHLLVPKRFHGMHDGHVARYFRNPRPRPMGNGVDLRGRRKDGSEFPVEISLSPVETAGGRLVAAAIRDASERMRREVRRRAASDRALRTESAARSTSAEMNERLIVSSLREHEVAEAARLGSEAKSRFLAAMSHELRTPLNAITGYTGLIEEGIGGPVTAKQEQYLQRIQAAAGHLVGLIDDVLDLAKVEAGQMRIEGKPGSVGDAVAAALALVEPQAVDAGVTLALETRAGDCRYVGDPDRVRQILLNLLSNAVKFTDRGGRVTVTFGEAAEPHPDVSAPGEGPWTFVAVEDTGIGIPPEDAGAMFEPFIRAQVDSSTKRPGTGLGLAISRELARRMEGDLTLRSTVGQGSCFTVWLPSCTPTSS
jgi:protein-histidine pros-kinase